MDLLLIAVLLLFILVLYRIFPDLFAPRCPLCGARLEVTSTESLRAWGRWRLGARRFSCVQCLYFHRRPVIYRVIQDGERERHHSHERLPD